MYLECQQAGNEGNEMCLVLFPSSWHSTPVPLGRDVPLVTIRNTYEGWRGIQHMVSPAPVHFWFVSVCSENTAHVPRWWFSIWPTSFAIRCSLIGTILILGEGEGRDYDVWEQLLDFFPSSLKQCAWKCNLWMCCFVHLNSFEQA